MTSRLEQFPGQVIADGDVTMTRDNEKRCSYVHTRAIVSFTLFFFFVYVWANKKIPPLAPYWNTNAKRRFLLCGLGRRWETAVKVGKFSRKNSFPDLTSLGNRILFVERVKSAYWSREWSRSIPTLFSRHKDVRVSLAAFLSLIAR